MQDMEAREGGSSVRGGGCSGSERQALAAVKFARERTSYASLVCQSDAQMGNRALGFEDAGKSSPSLRCLKSSFGIKGGLRYFIPQMLPGIQERQEAGFQQRQLSTHGT